MVVENDLRADTVWFTSGSYYHGALMWSGDDIVDTSGASYWASGQKPVYDGQNNDVEVFTKVAYVRGGKSIQGYGWKIVSPSIPSAYICEMLLSNVLAIRIENRDFGYGQRSVNEREIERGPVMLEQPRPLAIFGGPPDAYIECKAQANPHPLYSWHRSGNITVTSVLDNRYTLSAGRFSIQNPDGNIDAGMYQCMAENKYGKILSDPAQILFGYLHHFSPVKLEDVEANKFEGSRISCQAPAAYPEVGYTWFYNSIAEPVFEENKNMFVSSSGYLYFSEVQPTDFRKYFCSVTLIAPIKYDTAINQPPSRISLGVYLRVTGTEHGYFKPYIYTHTFPSPALKGSKVRLECVAYGSRPLQYAWHRRDGRPFEQGTELSDLNRVLTIKDAKIEAEGDYVCTVTGRVGVTTKVVTLSMEAKPYFTHGIGDRLADPAQTVEWRCLAVARPQPTYTWYKNGVMIQNKPGVIEVKKHRLIIYKVNQDKDGGMYQCGATNIHGTTFSYGQLKVLSFAPTFDRYPMVPQYSLPQGGNFSIPCGVEGAPTPDITWLKNGSPLSVIAGDTIGKFGMTLLNDLVFNNIDFTDQGRYTCKGTNMYGEAENSTFITVIRGITISIPPTNTRVAVNRTAFLSCQASYDSKNFDLSYQWTLNGHVINFTDNAFFSSRELGGYEGISIDQAQFYHTGRYTCEARTTIHTARASADLFVEGPPGAPAGAYVMSSYVTSDSVQLAWTITAQINHGSPIYSYNIEAEMENVRPGVWETVKHGIFETQALNDARTMGLRSDQRVTLVDGLLPNVHYSFRVRAINDLGEGREASRKSVSVKTPSMAPATAPKNVRGYDKGKVGTLNIVWDPLEVYEYGGNGVGYTVYFKRQGDIKDWFKANVNGSKSSMYTYLVGVDNYYLEYEVMVAAYNEHGAGPNSTVKVIMSAEGMPTQTVLMGDCDNYNGTAFSVSWNPIEDTREVMKGKLKGYRVRYWHIDFPEFVTWRDVYGQQDTVIIIGAEPNTNYWASVQVMNNAGVGPNGEIRLAETFHLPPQNYPRHVKVWTHSEHSVRVTWQGVSTMSNDEESLQGYIIRVWKIQEDIRTATDTVVDIQSEAIVKNLQTQTVYVLRVLGFSLGGDGLLSPHVYFTVEGGNIPFDPTTTETCYRMLDDCNTATWIRQSSFTIFYLTFLSIVYNIL
ncbi:Contactin-3 [Mactra antiquata]